MSISLRFYGKDYSRIDELINDSNEMIDGIVLDKSKLTKILIKFLDEYNKKIQNIDNKNSLIINGKSKKTDYKIYNTDAEGNYYFDGLVGVVSGKLEIYKSDIVDYLSQEDNNTKYDVDIQLQIKSRFDGDKPYFLSTMLQMGNPFPNNELVTENKEDEFFDFLLTYCFMNRFLEANQKGYYRTYTKFENNDDRVRGNIDVARHIKLNMEMKNGKTAYSYKEKSTNNFLNHLIVHAYKVLKTKYYNLVMSSLDANYDFKNAIDYLQTLINYPIYNTKTLITKNLNILAHPYYTEYEELRKVCIKILRNEGSSFFDGDSNDLVDGLLFYLPDLWEDYLMSLLKCDKYDINAQETIKVFSHTNSDNKIDFKQPTRPDFVFYRNKKPFMILDAKFKPAWGNVIEKKSSLSYLLDDYDKCLRDMISINAKATGVVFPTNIEKLKDIDNYVIHQISDFTKDVIFYTFPIYVEPASGNYETWRSKFDDSCNNITSKIKDYIIKELEYNKKIEDLQKELMEIRKN